MPTQRPSAPKPARPARRRPQRKGGPVDRAVVGEWDVSAPDWPKLDPGLLSVAPRRDGPCTWLRHEADAHNDRLTITVGDDSGRPVLHSVTVTEEGSLCISVEVLRLGSRVEGANALPLDWRRDSEPANEKGAAK